MTWTSIGVEVEGTVEKTVARASKDDPRVVVTSGKTGARAVHKPDALRSR